MKTTYQEFIEAKKHTLGNFCFEPNFIPDIAFDFQKHIIERDVRKGRIANFVNTGLGKTLIQISVAVNVINHTNKNNIRTEFNYSTTMFGVL
jgi:hypothetical protein